MNGYLLWVASFVSSEDEMNSYSDLFAMLNSFCFVALIHHDEDRILDAEEMRREFVSELPNEVAEFPSGPSVMEVLVALARRLDNVVGYESSSPARWFWWMIDSLGMANFKNGTFKQSDGLTILYNFVMRKFEPDGRGSTCYFPCGKDLRDVDIWYQWMYYLNSLEEFKG